jgi:hypothetical protein
MNSEATTEETTKPIDRDALVARLRRWSKISTCRRKVHACALCFEPIVLGQRYHDAGPGKRAHVECVSTPAVEVGETTDEQLRHAIAVCRANGLEPVKADELAASRSRHVELVRFGLGVGKALGATDDEEIDDAAQRVVRERDEWKQIAENRESTLTEIEEVLGAADGEVAEDAAERVASMEREAWQILGGRLGKDGAADESIVDAARRVVRERDEARAEALRLAVSETVEAREDAEQIALAMAWGRELAERAHWLRGIVDGARYCLSQDNEAAARACLDGNGLEDGVAEELRTDIDMYRAWVAQLTERVGFYERGHYRRRALEDAAQYVEATVSNAHTAKVLAGGIRGLGTLPERDDA